MTVDQERTGPAPTPRALIDWRREGLEHFNCPRSVRFATELPKTATGKVQRFRVKEQLLAESEVIG
jgi:acyl-coenzyme A synthetase/AMP-(fatty) acid ligase